MERITELCTGCRACEQLCAHHAISMQSDREGFLTAVIDKEQCVDCGLCYKRCPQNTLVEKNEPLSVYAVQDKDDKEIKVSASGGAFAAAARMVLQQGGVVVGAAYNDDLTVSHIVIDSVKDLPRLQSSKYVQSNTEATYKQVKALLAEGRTVLYSGTPCQIGGLKAFLRKPYDNLYTMEVICHGVASPALFARYIEWLGGKMKGKVIFYNFRDKSYGWGLGYKTKIKTKIKIKIKSSSLDPYYYHFLEGTTYRECCYRCNYCCKERNSDITAGDYWGIMHEHPKFYSLKGVSCLLVNTPQGERLWSIIAQEFYTLESTFEQVARHNHNLRHPTPRPSLRDIIYYNYNSISLQELFEHRLRPPFNVKAWIKGMVPKWLLIRMTRAIHGRSIKLLTLF